MASRHILTIATGKKIYVDFANNLARSFFWWHPDTDISFRIVTDQPAFIADDIKDKVKVINIKAGELGEGFSTKLHLDQLVIEGQTLFIDSDCLIYGNLTGIFDKFKGYSVSVIGNYVSNGEWFGDISSICKKFNITKLPKFNGGIYYVEKGSEATAVYETARSLEKRYDEIGFVRLRNRPNDEVLMALAMQLHNKVPLLDDGTIMSDPQACPGPYHLDVIKGKTHLVNPPYPDIRHQDWYPFKDVKPLIVHFLGYYTQQYQYRLDAYRLEKASKHKLNFITKAKGILIIKYPYQITTILKEKFRPLYRYFFGTRKIQISERI